MGWTTGSIDGVTIQRRASAAGGEANPYYDSIRRAFLDSVGQLPARLGSGYAVAEPFSSETGLTLTNAVVENGYVRNTVLAGVEQLPTMTSNTTPAGNTASASSIYSGSYPAWKMWNKSASTSDVADCWVSANGVGPHWCRLKTETSYTFRKYRLYGRGTGNNGNPISWQLQISSDDGANWTTVDSRSGQSIGLGGYGEYTLSQNVTATDIRILVTEWNIIGGGYTYTCIGALRLYAAGETSEATITPPLVQPEGSPVEGYVLLKIMDSDNPANVMSVGNSGTDLVNAALSINGGAAFTPLSFGTPEDAQFGYFRFTSAPISLAGQTGIQLRITSHDRGAGAPNFRIDDAIIIWRY